MVVVVGNFGVMTPWLLLPTWTFTTALPTLPLLIPFSGTAAQALFLHPFTVASGHLATSQVGDIIAQHR